MLCVSPAVTAPCMGWGWARGGSGICLEWDLLAHTRTQCECMSVLSCAPKPQGVCQFWVLGVKFAVLCLHGGGCGGLWFCCEHLCAACGLKLGVLVSKVCALYICAACLLQSGVGWVGACAEFTAWVVGQGGRRAVTTAWTGTGNMHCLTDHSQKKVITV